MFTIKKSFDSKQCICEKLSVFQKDKCHVKLYNFHKLFLGEIPPEMSVLEKHEQIRIAQRI